MQQPISTNEVQQIGNLKLKDLAEVLVKHYNLHEGLYAVSIEFQIAVGAVGPTPDVAVPGAMLGVSGVGLVKADSPSPQTIDASEVNPKKRSKKS